MSMRAVYHSGGPGQQVQVRRLLRMPEGGRVHRVWLRLARPSKQVTAVQMMGSPSGSSLRHCSALVSNVYGAAKC